MMTTDKIREAFAACRRLIPNPDAKPIRNGTDSEHLAFMCVEGATYADGRREKAMRWLGFVQGALWVGGDADIETLKGMNRPDEPESSTPMPGAAPMTLDEAIEHADEKAQAPGPCGAEHRRLGAWLVELRERRAAPGYQQEKKA